MTRRDLHAGRARGLCPGGTPRGGEERAAGGGDSGAGAELLYLREGEVVVLYGGAGVLGQSRRLGRGGGL